MAAVRALARGLRSVRPAVQAFAPLRPQAAFAVPTQRRYISSTPDNRSLLEGKTGQTGALVLGAGVAAALVSKEVIILHNESIIVASVALVTATFINKFGGSVAKALDNRAKAIHDSLGASRTARIEQLEAAIAEQKELLGSLTGIPEVFDINRELANMSRELAYRSSRNATRAAAVEQLESFIKIEAAEMAAEQVELVNQLEAEVTEALKSQEDAILAKCISDLKALTP